MTKVVVFLVKKKKRYPMESLSFKLYKNISEYTVSEKRYDQGEEKKKSKEISA